MDSLPNGTISGESRYGYTNNSAAANIISIGNVNSNGSLNSCLNKRNWMIFVIYARKDFYECKMLIKEELKSSNGYNEFANYMQGIILRDEGQIQESLNSFKKCNSLSPKNAENLRQIGRSLFLLGRYELAIEAFLRAEKLLSIMDWNIFYNLGICYMKTSKLDKAKEYLSRAAQLGKSEQSFIALSNLYLLQQNLQYAVDALKAAIRLYPSSVDLSVNLGLVYMKVLDYHRAFNELGTALAYAPTNSKALFTFAAEIQRHGEYDIAISKYKIAAQSLSNSAELWNNIGMCFFGKKKYVAAITCLKRSHYLAPLNWITLFNLGLLHLNTRQYASAAIFLSSAAKLHSQHGSIFTLLAVALKNLGDTQNCQKSLEEALKRNPKDPEACLNYAIYFYTLGNVENAKIYFEQFQTIVTSKPPADKELLNAGFALNKLLNGIATTTITTPEHEDNEDVLLAVASSSGGGRSLSVTTTDDLASSSDKDIVTKPQSSVQQQQASKERTVGDTGHVITDDVNSRINKETGEDEDSLV